MKNGKPKQAGFSPPKEYVAQYIPNGNGSSATYPRTNASMAAEAKPGPEVFAETGVPADDIPF